MLVLTTATEHLPVCSLQLEGLKLPLRWCTRRMQVLRNLDHVLFDVRPQSIELQVQRVAHKLGLHSR